MHPKLDEKLDPEAARSCANLRTGEAAAPAAAKLKPAAKDIWSLGIGTWV